MAEKSAKKKTKKATKASADPSVLGNLRSTRPTPLGGNRRGAATRTRAASATTATTAAPRAATTAAAAKTETAAKPKAAPRKAAAPKAAKAPPKTSAPKAADAKAAKLRKPAPAPPAGWQTPGQDGRRKRGQASGTEIVTTAVQAAGELAQLGATIGGQLLRRAAGRIPRP
jgi:hypothetical protein